MNASFVPNWPNIDLGFVQNERYGKRIIGIFKGVWLVLRQRGDLRAADVIIARNFDLLVIAWLTRIMSGTGRVPLVYECLDIHGLFTKTGPVGAMMRWCERRLLARVQLLIVSSPGFITHYFSTIQGYRGRHAIIENKLWFDGNPIPRPTLRPSKDADAVLTIGWVGSIRCAPSLKILMDTADYFGDRIAIRIHGNIHHHALPDFDDQISRRENVSYFGPYDYPTGLASAYAQCDMVWAQDLWQQGANSDWLLPNRIYEASWFGCPSIAVADTETGRKVSADKLGFTVNERSADALVSLIEKLDQHMIAEVSDNLLATDSANFMLVADDVQAALRPVMPARD